MKDFSLFKKKILFVFPLIYAPGPAASVWNVFGKTSKPALIVHGWLWAFKGRLPHNWCPRLWHGGGTRMRGTPACWRTHLKNHLALASWFAVKVALVCFVVVFSFGLSTVEMGLCKVRFYCWGFVLRKSRGSRIWFIHALFPHKCTLNARFCPSYLYWTSSILLSSVTCGHLKL